MGIKHLEKRREELNAQADGIIKAAEAESRQFTDEEREQLKALKSERATVESDIEAAEEWAAQAPAKATPAGDPLHEERKAEGSWHVKNHEEDRPWESLGEQLTAIASAMTPHGHVDPRLNAAASGASAGDPGSGGFLIQSQYSERLLARAREESVLLPLVDTVPLGEGFESIDMPYIEETSRATGSRWGGVRVYRRKEAATVESSKPSLELETVRLYDMMGLAYATDRLVRNAAAIESIFENAFASEFAFKIDDEIISGDGAGEMLGILSGATGNPKVSQAKETGQAAATIQHANLSNMWTHMPPRLRGNSVWLVNGEIDPQLDEMSVPAGTGAVEPRIVSYDATGAVRIKGRPVIPIEQCPALGTEGDIILANLGQYMVITQGGLRQDQSMHVRFIYGEMTYRWMYPINGQPKWRTSVSPYKGSATLSPFVTLATRA